MTHTRRQFLRNPSHSTPARTLNSAPFTPSSIYRVWVAYTVRIQSSLTLVGGQAGRVELRISSAGTTPRGGLRGGTTGTVIVGVSNNDDSSSTASGWVLPGEQVVIATANTTGSPTYTLEIQEEVIFNGQS